MIKLIPLFAVLTGCTSIAIDAPVKGSNIIVTTGIYRNIPSPEIPPSQEEEPEGQPKEK